MAEANKCDVVDCGAFSDGSPVGRFQTEGATKTLCKAHTDALVKSYFPDLLPAEIVSAPATPEQPVA